MIQYNISWDFRISGFQDFRISGFQDFRISGFQDFRILTMLDVAQYE